MEYKNLNDFEIINHVNDSEEATDVLFEKYRPLINSLAKKLYTINKTTGLEISDLIQEGMVGFSKAINTYNEHRDVLFFTYAKKCIEAKMISSVVGANRLKHKILNTSLSMEAIDEEVFHNGLDKILADTSTNPEAIMVDYENLNALIDNITKNLTPFEEQVFALKKSGFTYTEIADILDADAKKIDNALQRIRMKVKDYLDKRKMD